jgi:hypothetical protein
MKRPVEELDFTWRKFWDGVVDGARSAVGWTEKFLSRTVHGIKEMVDESKLMLRQLGVTERSPDALLGAIGVMPQRAKPQGAPLREVREFADPILEMFRGSKEDKPAKGRKKTDSAMFEVFGIDDESMRELQRRGDEIDRFAERMQKASVQAELDAMKAESKFQEELGSAKARRSEENRRMFQSLEAVISDPSIAKVQALEASMQRLGGTVTLSAEALQYFKDRSWDAFGSGLLDMGVGAITSFGEAFINGVGQAIEHGRSFSRVLGEIVKSLAYQLSASLFAKGVAATIEGAALAASVITAPLAPGEFAKAGIYFAGAATLLGVGAALSASLRGGQAPGVSGGRAAQAPRPATVRNTTIQAGPTNVAIYLGQPGDPAAVNIARRTATAQAA